MTITTEQLYEACKGNVTRIKLQLYTPILNKYMIMYNITTTQRMSMFIANLLVESGRFNYVKELANGLAYEHRKDLGNINDGDGVKYKGRGLIQITGRNNYTLLTKDFKVDFITHPELLEQPEYAVRSACWYWSTHKLNEIADTLNFKQTVKLINGGLNGYDVRLNYYNQLIKVLTE